MNIGRSKVMSQSKHRNQRCITSLISEVILELTASQLRTRSRFGSYNTNILAFFQFMTDKWEGNTGEVRTTTKATDHYIRIFSSHFHLLFSFQTNDCLMQHHMIHDTTQRIFAVRCTHCQLDCFGNSSTQATLIIRMIG